MPLRSKPRLRRQSARGSRSRQRSPVRAHCSSSLQTSPDYQQAAAIERATRQLTDVSNVDVQEFERGRLVLEVQSGNPAALADQMLSSAPRAMSVVNRSPDAITFQLS